ncbi:hypothetical protein PHYBLDRAFT_160582 [Phycomyces blakesleeanus NRRL 1555(-)]|uniref:Uncharacterized protein n=3 Tax=Phycomyces blakesleeanus TaxID=4837 RepID=A0A162ZFS4_PHYB8|nr:hypothetical protein PHYBLDRAFT_160582 [Phycomyces blakesleeanus NRRL 1555(-)]OAD66491.1 hypothetical protein PHYBLDRAFT_160582 [Phycomyces blakesleeanus NRRL 1555(-)]|eukprot:XP_018284531.1 hypothetical protein PHYBLDRAFT_160582 [Phycomyces blakesleeanus NRRL 1555(-)]
MVVNRQVESTQSPSVDTNTNPTTSSVLSNLSQVNVPIIPRGSSTPGVIPGAYDETPLAYASWNPRDPFVPFVVMAILLGLAAQLGVTDDWTVPITLVTMVSGFLWSGAAKGVQLKVNLH